MNAILKAGRFYVGMSLLLFALMLLLAMGDTALRLVEEAIRGDLGAILYSLLGLGVFAGVFGFGVWVLFNSREAARELKKPQERKPDPDGEQPERGELQQQSPRPAAPDGPQLVANQLRIAAEVIGDHLRFGGDEAEERVDHGARRTAAQ